MDSFSKFVLWKWMFPEFCKDCLCHPGREPFTLSLSTSLTFFSIVPAPPWAKQRIRSSSLVSLISKAPCVQILDSHLIEHWATCFLSTMAISHSDIVVICNGRKAGSVCLRSSKLEGAEEASSRHWPLSSPAAQATRETYLKIKTFLDSFGQRKDWFIHAHVFVKCYVIWKLNLNLKLNMWMLIDLSIDKTEQKVTWIGIWSKRLQL